MPRGVYDRKGFVRTTKESLNEFIKFCHRFDIAEKLKIVKRPHQLAVTLYEKETGIKISSQTSSKNLEKIMKDVTVEEFVTFLNENDLKHMHSNSEYEEEVNEHIAHKHKRITIPMLEAYVKFTFRDDIKNILDDETIDLKNRVMKVVKMYKDETNKDIFSSIQR